ncbi:BhlA/UviB family holin-like peptide [Peribacillus frigoritolerans]|uniref:BhlA/UviB family holin-like peptide n=1 Tax=Peribacillus frigoritolerans TaxID=450367 RepID=UPI002227EE1C|nr:BhlA/UviB family holin-like peptide [Peribacillus frigoritolerans]UYZ01230.1 BhlA/UviB family holin-like peptide [Peribacillus frigoritolerans]
METEIFNLFLKQGGYAVLFVWLLWTTMKTNKEREANYQAVIEKNQVVIETQAQAFSTLAQDVNEIKQIIVQDNKN